MALKNLFTSSMLLAVHSKVMAELLSDAKERVPPSTGVMEHIRLLRAPFAIGLY
ncbi:hypothetical protein CYLTODRAFT_427705 [Cylindrobasidium torrendii FP15055 ss-10]|uniref:Uncharacterized protein n=1 Tax=Cylindrobasidium torrendii FP15055 ss-10 TaxID=1314674 RepID=A0A0D7ASN7_9AGAR|nr:hypothetical protein CYLTODRAFT_427705 [Cylindrobasidium torrendii FP15055 ss-10]